MEESGGYVFKYQFDLADRMRKTLRVIDMPVHDIADSLGVSRNTVGNWLAGRSKPSAEQLVVWAALTGAPHGWLSTGARPGNSCGNHT